MTFEIKSELVPDVKGQRFRKGGRLYRNVRIYLEAVDDDLDAIDSVQYELHPSFRQRIRVSENRAENFEIRIWTYGYFKIRAKLLMRDDSIKSAEGIVRW